MKTLARNSDERESRERRESPSCKPAQCPQQMRYAIGKKKEGKKERKKKKLYPRAIK